MKRNEKQEEIINTTFDVSPEAIQDPEAVVEEKTFRSLTREEKKDLAKELVRPQKLEPPEALKIKDEEVELKDKSKAFHWFLNITTFISITAIIVLTILAYKRGIFTSQETLTQFVESMGWAGPFIFILIQMIQVIIPIIPGAVSLVAGVLMFGPWLGFLYNYIGISLGSIIVFFLSRYYGKPLVLRILGKKNYNKYIGWTSDNKKFEWIFAILIFMPVAPDDALCYIAGLTTMQAKRFIGIILLGKPVAIAAYSFGLHLVINHIWEFIQRVL